MTHTKIYTNIHNITNIRLCSAVQSIVVTEAQRLTRSRRRKRRHEVSGKLLTQCSHDSQQSKVSATKDQVSEAGGSQVQHRSHGLLAAAGSSKPVDVDEDSSVVVGICIEPAGYHFTDVNETVHQRLRTHTVLADRRLRHRSRTVVIHVH